MDHEKYIKRCYELAVDAGKKGFDPFGALLVHNGRILEEAKNTADHKAGLFGHAEFNLVHKCANRYSDDILNKSVFYTSCAPCERCLAAIASLGVHSVVFGVSYQSFAKLIPDNTLLIGREGIFAGLNLPVKLTGPVLEEEGMHVFEYWGGEYHPLKEQTANSNTQPPLSELDKLKAGQPFWNSDPEIAARKKAARALADAFNATSEEEPEKRQKLLKELFGDCPDDIFIKPPFHCDYGFNIHLGKNFFANFQCVMLDAAPITIGDNCLMGPQTCLYTVNHPMDAFTRTANYVYGRPITIGDNVWFGGNCVVLSGVTIGNNAVIGSGSVVTKDIPANAVAAGNPAQILRYLDNTPSGLNLSQCFSKNSK